MINNPEDSRGEAKVALTARLKEAVSEYSPLSMPDYKATGLNWISYVQGMCQYLEIEQLLGLLDPVLEDSEATQQRLGMYLEKATTVYGDLEGELSGILAMYAQAALSSLCMGDAQGAWNWTEPILMLETTDTELANLRDHCLGQILATAEYHLTCTDIKDVDLLIKKICEQREDLHQEDHALNMAELYGRAGDVSALNRLLDRTIARTRNTKKRDQEQLELWKEVAVSIACEGVEAGSQYAREYLPELLSNDPQIRVQQLESWLAATVLGASTPEEMTPDLLFLQDEILSTTQEVLEHFLKVGANAEDEDEYSRAAEGLVELLRTFIHSKYVLLEFDQRFGQSICKLEDLPAGVVLESWPLDVQLPVYMDLLPLVMAKNHPQKEEQLHTLTENAVNLISKEKILPREVADSLKDLVIGSYCVVLAMENFYLAAQARIAITDPFTRAGVLAQMIIDTMEEFPQLIGTEDAKNAVLQLMSEELALEDENIFSSDVVTNLAFMALEAEEWEAYFRWLNWMALEWSDRLNIVRQTLNWLSKGVLPSHESILFDARKQGL